MAILRCKDEKCEGFDKPVDVNTMFLPYDYKRNMTKCPICHTEMTWDPLVDKTKRTVYLNNKYTNASPAEKHKILKKRSEEHYKKFVQPGRIGGSYNEFK